MAASLIGGGKTVVPVAGTPVPLAIPAGVAGPGSPGLSTMHALILSALSTNTGKVYIGVLGMNKTTLAGCIVVLPVPTVNLIPAFSISLTHGANALSLSDIFIDADVSGEGVLLGGVVA